MAEEKRIVESDVTPEMISAGIKKLREELDFDGLVSYQSLSGAARGAFSDMCAASQNVVVRLSPAQAREAISRMQHFDAELEEGSVALANLLAFCLGREVTLHIGDA